MQRLMSLPIKGKFSSAGCFYTHKSFQISCQPAALVDGALYRTPPLVPSAVNVCIYLPVVVCDKHAHISFRIHVAQRHFYMEDCTKRTCQCHLP